MNGLEMAVLYGLKPHQLGFCGPRQKKDQLLRDFLESGASAGEVKKVLKQFRAAYPYYCLIARSNGIKDPFDIRVVHAYWIGNKFLESVVVGDLRETIANEFSGLGLLPKDIAQKKAAEIPDTSLPHHSFHVLTLGAISGLVDLNTVKLKDLCRIGWGEVKGIKTSGEMNVFVKHQVLVEKNNKIIFGKPVLGKFSGDAKLLPSLKIGDWVSLHWGQIIQILTLDDVKNLRKYTLKNLNV